MQFVRNVSRERCRIVDLSALGHHLHQVIVELEHLRQSVKVFLLHAEDSRYVHVFLVEQRPELVIGLSEHLDDLLVHLRSCAELDLVAFEREEFVSVDRRVCRMSVQCFDRRRFVRSWRIRRCLRSGVLLDLIVLVSELIERRFVLRVSWRRRICLRVRCRRIVSGSLFDVVSDMRVRHRLRSVRLRREASVVVNLAEFQCRVSAVKRVAHIYLAVGVDAELRSFSEYHALSGMRIKEIEFCGDLVDVSLEEFLLCRSELRECGAVPELEDRLSHSARGHFYVRERFRSDYRWRRCFMRCAGGLVDCVSCGVVCPARVEEMFQVPRRSCCVVDGRPRDLLVRHERLCVSERSSDRRWRVERIGRSRAVRDRLMRTSSHAPSSSVRVSEPSEEFAVMPECYTGKRSCGSDVCSLQGFPFDHVFSSLRHDALCCLGSPFTQFPEIVSSFFIYVLSVLLLPRFNVGFFPCACKYVCVLLRPDHSCRIAKGLCEFDLSGEPPFLLAVVDLPKLYLRVHEIDARLEFGDELLLLYLALRVLDPLRVIREAVEVSLRASHSVVEPVLCLCRGNEFVERFKCLVTLIWIRLGIDCFL